MNVSGAPRVRRLWAAYEARDWATARTLFASGATCTWHTNGERFDGADAIVQVNAVYPEGWRITVLAVESLADGRVLSLVRVDHGPGCFFAHSWFRFGAPDGRIEAVDEYWATFEPPPSWREGLPGRVKLP